MNEVVIKKINKNSNIEEILTFLLASASCNFLSISFFVFLFFGFAPFFDNVGSLSGRLFALPVSGVSSTMSNATLPNRDFGRLMTFCPEMSSI